MGYLNRWEKTVSQRWGFTPEEKRKMLLSVETMTGLRLTGMFITTVQLYTSTLHDYIHLIIQSCQVFVYNT